MDLLDLIQISKIKAIDYAINPTLDSEWRSICRFYSEKFHTPLHLVVNELDPVFVLQNLYEDKFNKQLADEELEELLEILYQIKDPDYKKVDQQEIENIVDMAINSLNSRKEKLKKAEGINLPTKKYTIENKFNSPQKGSMNFKELEELENTIENKNKF